MKSVIAGERPGIDTSGDHNTEVSAILKILNSNQKQLPKNSDKPQNRNLLPTISSLALIRSYYSDEEEPKQVRISGNGSRIWDFMNENENPDAEPSVEEYELAHKKILEDYKAHWTGLQPPTHPWALRRTTSCTKEAVRVVLVPCGFPRPAHWKFLRVLHGSTNLIEIPGVKEVFALDASTGDMQIVFRIPSAKPLLHKNLADLKEPHPFLVFDKFETAYAELKEAWRTWIEIRNTELKAREEQIEKARKENANLAKGKVPVEKGRADEG